MTTTSSLIDTIPPEVIELALSMLDWRSLIKCKQVCGTFRALIDSSPQLQYTIELGIAHMEDGPPSCVESAARLKMLRLYQSNWANMRWQRDVRIPMEDGGLWELYGNVLAQRLADNSYKFLCLRSCSRGIKQREWTLEPVDVDARDFGLDESQDLFVLVAKLPSSNEPLSGTSAAATTEFQVHLKSLTTGKPHPLAPNSGVLSFTKVGRDLPVSLTVQISGTQLAILFHSLAEDAENELVIWNWHTGERQSLIGDSMRAFSFLGDHYVVMVLMQDDPVEEDVRPVMNVWDTRSATNGDAVRVEEANFVRSFRFPTLSDRAHLTEITIRSDPAPQWSPSSETQAPFYLARAAKLYVVTFWVILGNNARGISVFIPAATLLNRVTSADAATVVDWENWGPRGSLLLKSWIHPGSVWVCYVYGEKYVSFHPAGENTQSVVVFDFNEAAALRSGPMPEQPSVYKEKNIFKDEVVTNIPYRATLCRIQSGPAHGMCSEDAILLVDPRHRFYRVLSF
ncbi:hypothetical protein PLEOSDRAFT_1075174 [Pleurotus ostreatus PC15]|uniref:F-box domain-containing protein n=1 Tax=Pleurotus ostreatus (strain PC15) TaxID=1137138 RepID=A0A067P4Z4_PLEO1|nr:hypothetical protein PLEOSDRAFT_1075174 [Pleurotus ostreatus PC15]